MRVSLVLAWRELRGMFLSPTAWVVLAVYLALGGIFYVQVLEGFSQVSQALLAQPSTDPQIAALLNLNQFVVRSHLWVLCLLMMFLAPLLTMRMLAEERRAGTAELVLTSPVRSGELVAGKFLAGLGFMALVVALSLQYPLFLYAVGDPDLLPVLVGYLGLLLAGAAFIAIGLLASSLTDSPVIAAVLGLGLLLGYLFLSSAGQGASPETRELLAGLSFAPHFQNLAKGVLSLSDVLHLLSVTFLALFATLRVVDSQRWR